MDLQINDPLFAEKLKARTALSDVIDPELGVNIIDLGLVYGVEFPEADKLMVKMTLSTPHCPLGEAIEEGVVNALEAVFPACSVTINLVWEPVWNFDMISEAGREQLGLSAR